jgi:hypothetical protein
LFPVLEDGAAAGNRQVWLVAEDFSGWFWEGDVRTHVGTVIASGTGGEEIIIGGEQRLGVMGENRGRVVQQLGFCWGDLFLGFSVEHWFGAFGQGDPWAVMAIE